MTSWRDEAPEQAQDLDGLLDATLPFAQQMLDTYGEFFPYGVALTTDGETRMIAGDPELGERPTSQDVLATIVSGLTAQRDDLRAAAIVTDVRVADSDAIRVELEHRAGVALAVLLPYQKKRLGRGVKYSELRAIDSEVRLWSES